MAKPWDDTLKKLIHLDPAAFVAFIVPRARFIQEEPIVLEHEELKTDGLLQVEVQQEKMLLHIEFQTYHDKNMATRLLQYNVLTRIKRKLPVLSCVIYLLKDGSVPASPLRWIVPSGHSVLTFQFESMELSKLTPEDIIDTKQAVLLPLIALTDGGDRREQIDRMVREIQASESLEKDKRTTLELLGYTLASLIFRKHSREDQDWLIRSFHKMHEILRETPIYQEILREGREEGQLEYARSMLLDFTKDRFPQLMQYAKAYTENLSNVRVLKDLTLKVGIAQDVEEASHYLLDWREIYKYQLS